MLPNYWRVSTHYLINAYVEKGDKLPCGGLEAYNKIVALTNYFWVKMGKIYFIFLEGINA